MNKEHAQESFDLAFTEFNWIKTHETMEFLNWKWSMPNNRFEVPEILDMQKTVKDLFKTIKTYEYGYGVSTGGFRVFIDADGDMKFVGIQFILTESDGILG